MTLKLPKGKIPADADLVVTLSHKEGIGFYLPDERRWVVSYPEQHHQRGTKKERATSNRFKRTIRMFKAARNQLVSTRVLTKEDAPSYFIECLLYNVPGDPFGPELAPTYVGILTWLKTAKLNDFQCQNGQLPLFGHQPEQWSVKKARAFVKALQDMWDTWEFVKALQDVGHVGVRQGVARHVGHVGVRVEAVPGRLGKGSVSARVC